MIDPLDPSTLEDARKAAGLSRAELAALSAVDYTTIMRIEAGKCDPRVEGTWASIVRALRRSVSKSCAAPGDDVSTQPPIESEGECVVLCAECGLTSDHPAARACEAVDCPRAQPGGDAA